jgi:hypothetical protein
MTRQDFLTAQGDIHELLAFGYDAVPCNCEDPHCPRWQLLNRSQLPPANIWLDDLPHERRAVPDGYLHVKNVEEAKACFTFYNVQHMSLDHDLGACEDCKRQFCKQYDLIYPITEDQWLEATEYRSMPYCSHIGTGYDFCLWMAENEIWPAAPPTVHSGNMVGAVRMEGVIQRYYPVKDGDGIA